MPDPLPALAFNRVLVGGKSRVTALASPLHVAAGGSRDRRAHLRLSSVLHLLLQPKLWFCFLTWTTAPAFHFIAAKEPGPRLASYSLKFHTQV